MPDWSQEIREIFAKLNLDPTREAEVIEELSQHLRDRYEEMLISGIAPEQAYQALQKELKESSFAAEFKATIPAHRPSLSIEREEKQRLAGIWE
ncbi:MAG TPA: permease prefix domain 1-containing protein [Alloacidobacterium sp.]|nr:permease prefix domain 1-containing protein [Alloacidobacterium sp.]